MGFIQNTTAFLCRQEQEQNYQVGELMTCLETGWCRQLGRRV